MFDRFARRIREWHAESQRRELAEHERLAAGLVTGMVALLNAGSRGGFSVERDREPPRPDVDPARLGWSLLRDGVPVASINGCYTDLGAGTPEMTGVAIRPHGIEYPDPSRVRLVMPGKGGDHDSFGYFDVDEEAAGRALDFLEEHCPVQAPGTGGPS